MSQLSERPDGTGAYYGFDPVTGLALALFAPLSMEPGWSQQHADSPSAARFYTKYRDQDLWQLVTGDGAVLGRFPTEAEARAWLQKADLTEAGAE